MTKVVIAVDVEADSLLKGSDLDAFIQKALKNAFGKVNSEKIKVERVRCFRSEAYYGRPPEIRNSTPKQR